MSLAAPPMVLQSAQGRPVRSEPARPAVQAADLYPARPSVVAARMVQVLPKAAEEQPLAEAVVVQQLGPPAVRAVAAAVAQEVPRVPEAWAAQPKAVGVVRAAQDAAAAPQPGATSDAEVPLPEAAAVLDVAAEAPRQGAEAERASAGAVLLPGAAPVAEVRRQAVRGEPVVPPSAAAWAAAPSTQLRADRLAPSLPALTAHVKARLRIAQP